MRWQDVHEPIGRWGGKFRGFRRTDAATNLRENMKMVMGSLDVGKSLEKDIPLSLSLIFYIPQRDLYFKNGKLKRKDVSNLFKTIEDIVSDYLGTDDSFHMDIHGYKRVSEDDRYHIVVALSDEIHTLGNLDSSWIPSHINDLVYTQ